ncbi:MAG TPA: trigger factor [Polyangiaceae bacterium]|jgi:trigger factor|nr:trigger factor [Polyangiaceae bacterium]
MQVAAEKLSPVLLQLAVQITAERVNEELSKAYREISRTAKVRGFRPGKAPRTVLAHMYGPRVTRDVVQRLVDETYNEALNAQNVQPVSQPAIETNPLKDNEPFSYTARVEIVPQIDAVKYEGFEVTRPSTKVTDELMNEELESLRRANSTMEPPKEKRAAIKGDFATIDFEVWADGKLVEGAGTKDYDTELGAGSLLSEIDSALLGQLPGAQVEVQIAMGAGHPNPALQGKQATFKITLKEIKERILPQLDDEFAKDLGDFTTLEALRTELTGEIEKRLKEQADNQVAEALVTELVKANPIEVPPALVRQQLQVTEQELTNQAKARGQKRPNFTAEMRAELQRDAEMKVRAGLLMAEIAKAEKIKIGDKELEEGIVELAQQTGKNVAKVRAEYRDQKKREMLFGMILENKVLDIIQAKSKINDQ